MMPQVPEKHRLMKNNSTWNNIFNAVVLEVFQCNNSSRQGSETFLSTSLIGPVVQTSFEFYDSNFKCIFVHFLFIFNFSKMIIYYILHQIL